MRAGAINIRGRQVRYGESTIRELVGSHAPASDGNHNNANYERHICNVLGGDIGPEDPLDFSDPDILTGLLTAMIEFETTRDHPYTEEQIANAVRIAVDHQYSNMPTTR